jgi:hypothetical protein
MKDQMGGACGTYGGEQESSTGFPSVHLREEDRFKNIRINGRILLKLVLKKYDGNC